MSDFSELYDALKGEIVSYFDQQIDAYVTHKLSRCESPIERILGEALVLMSVMVSPEVLHGHEKPIFEVEQQVVVRNFRLDFLVSYSLHGKKWSVAVECDGHDYHERTKEQAKRDKSRDRILAIDGIQTLRFTGSEIVSRPDLCAEQVLDYLTGTMRREVNRDE